LRKRCNISEYTIVKGKYFDSECIKSSLKDLGYIFEDHLVSQNLYGYTGDKRKQTANIIVRRKHVGVASNDVGFKKQTNGNYELVISEFDSKGQTGINFLQKMKQLYAKHVNLKKLKRLNKVITSVKVLPDGRIKIKALG